ncbi:MAG: GIY-YIG nuclease family protein [Weeksellaceae bacterium]
MVRAQEEEQKTAKSAVFFIYMHWVYIIYSTELDTYYVGETSDLERRMDWHNQKEFAYSFTAKANDWVLFHQIECKDITQARKIEKYIKDMKSRKYIENLKIYPEITEKLLKRFI